ncbi:pantoate--beta-alanine ligase [Rhodococcus ruber Chol-4]|uniref:pantoate--beta-alanine ligase n=1 Tax=Rhodococcus TaxID=1827 RepID=UPI00029AECC3|nr:MULTISPECIES: pantoate--beta-alanine ligase [Rhodococcus]MDX5311444.1 pantoate--beta-alanine ligase [Rhodococcus sp. (in: high G+C Gram-positive bacteria)]ATQ30622.1 pantoate--beta-alanine ligase [Rhodococcus ruber]AXY50273.1 pantoate--beta-alanine ligase [Rhodococcus ruber]KXF86123.1 pantoate--beta-alanine ligase [Rhodococcus ruber Chol-4]MBP2209741.1 pantoate--beta-alanine ligase [Rhodococcus ruber]
MSETQQGGYVRGELTVHHDPAGLTKVTKALRGVGRTVALVPTMGALHAGHLELVRQAKLTGAVVVVSIFVNPLQFGAGEDLDAYPRTLDADLALLREAGVELAFAPTAAAMYPEGRRTMIHPGPLGAELEGGSRPTHFAGMLTVVAKLLQIAAPNVVFFGEKDYQQLALVRQMVQDLNFDVRIVGVPTVREQDGLALSSRNRYLDPEQRRIATVLSAALVAGAHAAAGGPEAVLTAARAVLAAEPSVELDYLELRGADLGPAPERGDGRLLIAARIGTTRLIDNVGVAIGTGFLERETGPVDASTPDDLLTRR